MPLFTTLSSFLPILQSKGGLIERMKENNTKWAGYEETKDEKRLYECKENIEHLPTHRPAFKQLVVAKEQIGPRDVKPLDSMTETLKIKKSKDLNG